VWVCSKKWALYVNVGKRKAKKELQQGAQLKEMKKILPLWDRCYDFSNIFAKKFSKKLAFLTQNKIKLCKYLIITLFF
jgi:predicted secreted acid phosphatase